MVASMRSCGLGALVAAWSTIVLSLAGTVGCGGNDVEEAEDARTTAFVIAPGSDIGVLDLDSRRVRMLTSGKDGEAWAAPTWSPDASRLAVTHQDCPACPTRITLIAAAGGAETPIPGTKGGDQPAWSPDGVRLVYALATASGRELVIVNADGSKPEELDVEGEEEGQDAAEAEEPGEVELPNHPAFSPDGSVVAFDAESSLERMRIFF
jgi:Tol biopolymer transport system component